VSGANSSPKVDMNQRRQFLKTSSAAALALCLAPRTMAAALRRVGRPRRIAPLATLHCADFAELLDSPFQVQESPRRVLSLLLAEARDMSSRFGRESFLLRFRGPPYSSLPQGTYRFEHRKIGSFSLFIVPMSGDRNGEHYEAVFNRLS